MTSAAYTRLIETVGRLIQAKTIDGVKPERLAVTRAQMKLIEQQGSGFGTALQYGVDGRPRVHGVEIYVSGVQPRRQGS